MTSSLPLEEEFSAEILSSFVRPRELKLLLRDFSVWIEINGEPGELCWRNATIKKFAAASRFPWERDPRLYLAVSREDPRHPYSRRSEPTGAQISTIYGLFAYIFAMDRPQLPVAAHLPTPVAGLDLCGVWGELMPGSPGFYLFEPGHPSRYLQEALRNSHALISEAPRKLRRGECREAV
jgi:hypothetical protein